MRSTRLGYVATLSFGWPFASERFSRNPERRDRVIRIRDLDSDADAVFTDEVPQTDADVTDGDILVAMDGDFTVRRWFRGNALLNQRVGRVRPLPSHDPRFLSYAIQRPLADIGAVKYATTVKHLSAGDLRQLPIPAIPPCAQRAIADYLDHECERVLKLDRALNQIAEAATESLVSQMRDAISIDGCSSVQIRYLARTGTGHTPSRAHPEWWVPDECVVPWFTLADVHQIRGDAIDVVTETAERISPLGVVNSAAVVHPAGTVLLSRTASVGFSAIMGVDMAVSQDFMTWTCGPRLRPHYLLYALRTSRPQLRRLMYGSTHNTIYMPDLLALRVPLPTVSEQDAAVDVIDQQQSAYRAAMSVIETARTRLAEYRDALITEAVTGQLDVTKVSEAQMDEQLHAAAEGAGRTDTLAPAGR